MPDENERAPKEEAGFVERSAEDADSSNRRVHPRYAVELDVTISSEHNFFQGFAENISAGGIFIATHVIKPIGEKMDVTIHLPGADEPVRGVGEVRWLRPYSESSDVPPGLGLRFLELEPGSVEAIEQFLKDREPLFYED